MITVLRQKSTYIYLIFSLILIAAALIIGIDDNPPGIILCYLGIMLFILAFTHNWQKAKAYLLLAAASLAGLVISAILHNIFESFGEGTFLGIIGVIFFLIAVLICPAGLLVGIAGSIVRSFKKVEAIKN
jgi:vacuolar-type H+-ATPase subunit I/STV1